MPKVNFIIYDQDGRKGNDFCIETPWEWLVKAREDYPESIISVENFKMIELREHEFNKYNSLVGIDVDNKILADKKLNKAIKESIPKSEEPAEIKPPVNKKSPGRPKGSVNGGTNRSGQGGKW